PHRGVGSPHADAVPRLHPAGHERPPHGGHRGRHVAKRQGNLAVDHRWLGAIALCGHQRHVRNAAKALVSAHSHAYRKSISHSAVNPGSKFTMAPVRDNDKGPDRNRIISATSSTWAVRSMSEPPASATAWWRRS